MITFSLRKKVISMTDFDTIWRQNQQTIAALEEEYYSDDRDYEDYDEDYPYDTSEEAYD